MQSLPVYVEVSDKYLWTLGPFCHLFNTFWSELQPVVIYGFTRPTLNLPPNFTFHQISKTPYPASKWSDALIEFLQNKTDELFVLLLCDYWLSRTVDHRGIMACADYIVGRPEVLRCDLTADRLYAGGMFDVESYGNYDIIETPHNTPYQMSLQAGIWRRSRMLELIHTGMTAWEVEVQIQPPETMRVLGTRQYPMRYANGILKGKIDQNQIAMLPDGHRQYVTNMIPEEFG